MDTQNAQLLDSASGFGEPAVTSSTEPPRFDPDQIEEPGFVKGREFPNGSEAAEAMLKWHITNLGKRPKDYMIRDLMLGNALRDRRLCGFQKLLSPKTSWLFDAVSTCVETNRMVPIIRAFCFLHYAHLIGLRERVETEYRGTIEKLLHCWPTMALVKPSEENPDRLPKVCKQAWLCPFCFSRAMSKLLRVRDRVDRPMSCQRLDALGHDVPSC